jgi:hypothetical protein
MGRAGPCFGLTNRKQQRTSWPSVEFAVHEVHNSAEYKKG